MSEVGSMPHGFFTFEQWNSASRRKAARWVPIKDFDAYNPLTGVIAWIESEGQPGFFRVVQTQRMIQAERIDGKLCLDRKHAGSLATLERSVQAFERDGGKWPAAKRPLRNK